MPSLSKKSLPLVYHLLFRVKLHKENNNEINYEKSIIKVQSRYPDGTLSPQENFDRRLVELIWRR